jgi:hypothetical protein
MTRLPSRLPVYASAVTLMTIDLTSILRPEQARTRLDHLHLAGAGVLAHRVRPDGTLSFSLEAVAAPAGAGEATVADWLEDTLAVGGMITAYNLYASVLPLIRSVTVPERHLDLAALAVADTRRFHDLTERVTGGAPVTFERACTRAGVEVIAAEAEREQSWWATGNTPAMVAVLGDRAIATWRLWLAQHVAAVGDVALGRRSLAEFERWRTSHPLPTTDSLRRPLPTIAR